MENQILYKDQLELQINEDEMLHEDTLTFNKLINMAYKNVTKAFDFGGWTEYYDEDDCVVMTTQDEGDGIITFDFGTGEQYRFKKEGFAM